jgi:hypothetical protein
MSCSYETRGWTLKEKPRQQQPQGAMNAALIAQTAR